MPVGSQDPERAHAGNGGLGDGRQREAGQGRALVRDARVVIDSSTTDITCTTHWQCVCGVPWPGGPIHASVGTGSGFVGSNPALPMPLTLTHATRLAPHRHLTASHTLPLLAHTGAGGGSKGRRGGGDDDLDLDLDEVPEDLYGGVDDQLRPEKPEEVRCVCVSIIPRGRGLCPASQEKGRECVSSIP